MSRMRGSSGNSIGSGMGAPAQSARNGTPPTFRDQRQSNASGGAADAVWDSVASNPAYVNSQGVDLITYPDGSSAHQGPPPYLVQYALLAGASTVNVARRAVNERNIVSCLEDFGPIVTTLTSKAWRPDYWHWVVWHGEFWRTNFSRPPTIRRSAAQAPPRAHRDQ